MPKTNNINIFVKGKKNKYSYNITTPDFDEALYSKDTYLETQDKISPIKADILAIKDSLEFVKENRGNGIIPSKSH